MENSGRTIVPKPLQIDPLEQSYRQVLLGQRICQLYCFMLIFEPLARFLSFGMEWLSWAIAALTASGDPGQAMPVLEQLFLVRSLRDLMFVANVWVVFTIYAAFRPAWWSLILCFIALFYNHYVAWLAIETEPMVWVGPSGEPLSDTALGDPFDLRDLLWHGGLGVMHVYFFALAVLGQRAIHARNERERAILSEFAPGQRGISSSLLALFHIPQAIRNASSKLLTGALTILAGVANFTNFWRLSVVFAVTATAPLLLAYTLAHIRAVDPAAGAPLNENGTFTAAAIVMMIFLAIAMVIPWAIKILGRLATRLAKWQMRTSLEAIQHRDHRAPVLFLRSFANDLVPLPDEKAAPASWLLNGVAKGVTLDYMMLEEGTRLGPCVALGNPDDTAPPYGVARGYFDHDDWKGAVRSLCSDSSAILLVLDETEGVDWEISHIARKEFAHKTLFLLAPSDIGTDRGRDLLGKALATTCDLSRAEVNESFAKYANHGDVARAPSPQLMGFVIEGEAALLLETTSVTQYTYLVALRFFLRSQAARLY